MWFCCENEPAAGFVEGLAEKSTTEVVPSVPANVRPENEETPVAEPEVVPTMPVVVTIVRAKAMHNKAWLSGTSGCFIAFGVEDNLQNRTEVVTEEENPFWMHEAAVSERKAGDALKLVLYDQVSDGTETALGSVTLSADEFEAEGFNGDVPIEITGIKNKCYVQIKVKLPGHDYPKNVAEAQVFAHAEEGLAGHGNLTDIKVVFEASDNGRIGIVMDGIDGCLGRIKAIKEGLAAERYNSDKPQEQRIEVGDFVYEINGETGAFDRMSKAEQSPGPTKFRIRKQRIFSVSLEKQGPSWGMSIKFNSSSDSVLLVTNVILGSVTAWNESNPSKKIQVQDRITSVNGRQGNSSVMAKELQSTDTVDLVVSSPVQF